MKIENLRSVGEEAPYTKLLDVGLGAGDFSRSAWSSGRIREALEAGVAATFHDRLGARWGGLAVRLVYEIEKVRADPRSI